MLAWGKHTSFEKWITGSFVIENIQVGDKVPDVTLYEGGLDGKVNLRQLTSKKAIIFGVPGAFTPGCSKVQLFCGTFIYLFILWNK